MKRLMLAAVAVLTLAIPLHAQPARAQQPLGIGTMGQGTLGYAMGAAIATVLQEKAGLSARIQPSSGTRSEEHTSELQSLMRISYAVFCLKKKNNKKKTHTSTTHPIPQSNITL